MPTMAASLDCVMPGFSPCLSSLLILQLLLLLLSILTTTLDTFATGLAISRCTRPATTLYNTGLLWQIASFEGVSMAVICLTGGIASGKSTAARFLANQGAEVIDADKLGHEAYAPGNPANDQIVAHFGEEVRAPNGDIDRKALGGKVFGQPDQLKALTDIVWPEIRHLAEDRIRSALDQNPARHVVLEAAVLIEAGWEDLGDEVWVVTVEPETAIARCMARDGLERAAVEQRLAAQLTNEERTTHAHRVLTNDASENELIEQLNTAFDAISNGDSA